MKRLILAIGCVLFSMLSHALTMHVGASKVVLNQAIKITLTSDDQQAQPDLTPLQKDFSVVGTERSMNYTLINGKSTSQSQWIILIKPRHKGSLIIPSFSFGNEKTPEGQVEVVDENLNVYQARGYSKGVILTAEVSNPAPYVNEQVIYTLKVHYQRQLINAHLAPPQMKTGMMMPLGEIKQYEVEENGIPTVVEAQQFVVFPQKSGKIKIKPAYFEALVMNDTPQQMSITGPKIMLDVKPAPLLQQGNAWLPAQKIRLKEHYDSTRTQLKAGEPLTRTLIVEATGIPAELLPPLVFNQDSHFGIYPEKPQGKNTIQDESLVGSAKTKVTYLFNQPGRIVIPAFTLTWFNVKTGQFEKAQLQSREIEVTGSAAKIDEPLPPQRTAPSKSQSFNQPIEKIPSSTVTQGRIAWYLASFFALGWLVTALCWWRQKKRSRAHGSSKKLKKALKRACMTHNTIVAKDYLLAWAKINWPKAVILNLNDVQALVPGTALAAQIIILSQALYQNSAKPWQGDKLWRALLELKRR